MKTHRLLLFLVIAVLLAVPAMAAAPEIPVPGTVTLLELGNQACPPCRLMAPILEEVRAEYRGKVAVLHVDVIKERGLADKYDLAAIPTQIFYDRSGKEAFRHTGFLGKESIVAILDGLIAR